VNQTPIRAPTRRLTKRPAQKKTFTALPVAKEALYSAKVDRAGAAIAPTHQPQPGAVNAPQPSKKSSASGKNSAMAQQTTMKSNTAPSAIVAAPLLATTLFQTQQHIHALTQAAAKKLPWSKAPPSKTFLQTLTLKTSVLACYGLTRCLWADDHAVPGGGDIAAQAKEHCSAICCASSGGDRDGGDKAVLSKMREVQSTMLPEASGARILFSFILHVFDAFMPPNFVLRIRPLHNSPDFRQTGPSPPHPSSL